MSDPTDSGVGEADGAAAASTGGGGPDTAAEPGGQTSGIDHFYSSLDAGISITEGDRPLYDGFATSLAEAGLGPDAFNAGLRFYQGEIASRASAVQDLDRGHATETSQELRESWGDDYENNVDTIRRFLGTLPASLEYGLASARDDRGRAILNDPQALEFLLELANGDRQSQPTPVRKDLYAMSRSDIEAVMGTPAYIRNEAMQERYRELVAREEGSSPRPTSRNYSGDYEIKQLEAYMRNNRKAYNEDEGAQKRLRYLYSLRALNQ